MCFLPHTAVTITETTVFSQRLFFLAQVLAATDGPESSPKYIVDVADDGTDGTKLPHPADIHQAEGVRQSREGREGNRKEGGTIYIYIIINLFSQLLTWSRGEFSKCFVPITERKVFARTVKLCCRCCCRLCADEQHR